MVSPPSARAYLKTGAEYLESLRDGREVWYRGERIADVTRHPLTAPAIAWHAKLYDAQHTPGTRELLTTVRADGARISTTWLAPRTPEELRRKREEAEHRNWLAFGSQLGRQPNHVSWNILGMAAHLSRFRKYCPDYADNLLDYIRYAQEQDVYVVGAAAEPQGFRARPAKAGADRSGVLRVVRESEEGIWLSGARAAVTAAVQAHEVLVGSLTYPHVLPEESFWLAVPIGSPGLKLICREQVSAPRAGACSHPLSALGEDMDAFLVFDEVFVPRHRIWALGEPELSDGALFSETARGEQWATLIRLCVRAEFLVGLAQLVVETLETADIPSVREAVGRMVEFAQILRGGVLAAEARAAPAEDGTLMPDNHLTIAFRAHAQEHFPTILQTLQGLCGQGLVVRFSEGDFTHPELGPALSRYLDARHLPARARNLLMNTVWDVTASAMAGRTQVYENVQGFTPAQRQALFAGFDRRAFVERVRALVGLEAPSK